MKGAEAFCRTVRWRRRAKSILTAAVADIMEITGLRDDCFDLREHIRGIKCGHKFRVDHLIKAARVACDMCDKQAGSGDDSQTSIHHFFKVSGSEAPETEPVMDDSKRPSPLPTLSCRISSPAVQGGPPCRHMRWHSASLWMTGSFVTSLLKFGLQLIAKKRKFEWHSKDLGASAASFHDSARCLDGSGRQSHEPVTLDCEGRLRQSMPSPVEQPCFPSQTTAENLLPMMVLMFNMVQAMQPSSSARGASVDIARPRPHGAEPCRQGDAMTETLGDCAARWKRLLLPDAFGRMPNLEAIIGLAASHPKPPQRALYSHPGEVKRLLAQDGASTIGVLFKPDNMSGSVAVYLKSGKVIIQGNSRQSKMMIEKMVQPWTQMWPLGGVAARRAGAAFSNLPTPEMARAMAANLPGAG
ncbi:unnamed protein product [Symbiodinium natans]|uniref:Uncharacterized protein n=1 Tax=Symbiodinium natans TaxID=878477 RepID=A0A812UJN6_9DINO|nr:unnamed protein product [Symbiodinium natans]